MKKTILTLALFALGFTVFAHNGGNEKSKTYNSLSELIQKKVLFLDLENQQKPEERALVYYAIAADGTLNLKSVECTNETYQGYISKKLEGVKLNKASMDKAEGQFLIVFKKAN